MYVDYNVTYMYMYVRMLTWNILSIRRYCLYGVHLSLMHALTYVLELESEANIQQKILKLNIAKHVMQLTSV